MASRRGGFRLAAQTFLEGSCAGAVEKIECLGGAMGRDQELGVVAVEVVAVAEEGEAAFFIFDGVALALEGAQGAAVPLLGLLGQMSPVVETGHRVFDLPANGGGVGGACQDTAQLLLSRLVA